MPRLMSLLPHDIDDLACNEIGGSRHCDGLLLLVERQLGAGAFQVVALRQLFLRLLICIVDFLHVDGGHYIEARFLGHDVRLSTNKMNTLMTSFGFPSC